jgi:hypothetical protein
MRAINVFVFVCSIALGACSDIGGDQALEIRVRGSGYEFQGASLASLAELEAALNARRGQRIGVSVSPCATEDRAADVLRAASRRR